MELYPLEVIRKQRPEGMAQRRDECEQSDGAPRANKFDTGRRNMHG